MSRPIFPFTAVVGQEKMRLALALNAVNPKLGGVLIRGEKGTAKSTAARALAALLPEIDAVAGCRFACDPHDPAAFCDECLARTELATVRRNVPFVELPIGATDDRVTGTLDMEHAIAEGRRRFEPGLLAAANRGVLYVDEVNLLNDHLVDVLLDAAAMGRNYVEREGISFSHPAQFILVGTMNPEEGDLRPQLLDRFGLAVDVEGNGSTEERVEVLRRRLAFEADPWGFVAQWSDAEQAERLRIEQARDLLQRMAPDDELLSLVARICAAYGVDGMRADIAMVKTALTVAAYRGRDRVIDEDVRIASELALLHRRRRQPFDQSSFDSATVERLMEELDSPPSPRSDETSRQAESPSADSGPDSGDAQQDRTFAIGTTFDPRRIEPQDGRRMPRAALGRRERVDSPTLGTHVRSVPVAALPEGSLALAATIRAAAPHQRARRNGRAPSRRPAILVEPCDLHVKLRESRAGNLIVFLVDASGSMAADERMGAVKGAIASLLLDAYRKRDRVALVSFGGDGAKVGLPPTNSVELAQRLLADLPVGGRTPLAEGLHVATKLIERAGVLAPNAEIRPLLVVLSDGRANVPFATDDALADAHRAAQALRDRVPSLVVDTETGHLRLGLAGDLAAAMDAPCLRIEELDAAHLAQAVRVRLGSERGW
ncbi:MAG TPA: magnesium chelatase subunit D family protein [Dehalococcoidia bacterium]|nr:magnesium chelatase subunit D family protein [Dehalococcoidia bacterium]